MPNQVILNSLRVIQDNDLEKTGLLDFTDWFSFFEKEYDKVKMPSGLAKSYFE